VTVSGIAAIILGSLIVPFGLLWFAWSAMLVGVALVAAGVWMVVIGRRTSHQDRARPALREP
jgi:uncharacterized membrane protein HdeD (DUF308 family)